MKKRGLNLPYGLSVEGRELTHRSPANQRHVEGRQRSRNIQGRDGGMVSLRSNLGMDHAAAFGWLMCRVR
jgi:hypothetical protein